MSMDVSEQPGNSIETIENYISDHYAGHEDYCNSVTPFVFPPGHTLRIRNFVLELGKKLHHTDVGTEPMETKQKKRRKSSSASKFKKPKLSVILCITANEGQHCWMGKKAVH